MLGSYYISQFVVGKNSYNSFYTITSTLNYNDNRMFLKKGYLGCQSFKKKGLPNYSYEFVEFYNA